jgi:KDO2-lipid IV(A) lauroyltransferase
VTAAPSPGRRLSWVFEALLARLALTLFAVFPVALASRLGAWLARNLGPLLPAHRRGLANLRLALPERAADHPAILRAAWANLGATVAELVHLQRLQITLEGAEHLPGHGPALMVSAHLANWEALPGALLARGITMGAVYRAPDNPRVAAMLARLRGDAGPMFPKGAAGARGALRHMAEGGILGLLADQKMNDGIAAPFFGHLAMTPAAPAALALRFHCPVVPGRVERLGPGRFRVVAEPPLPLPDSGDRAADLAALTAQINARIEAWIRARPGEWLWFHRRWPKSLSGDTSRIESPRAAKPGM